MQSATFQQQGNGFLIGFQTLQSLCYNLKAQQLLVRNAKRKARFKYLRLINQVYHHKQIKPWLFKFL